MSIQSQQALLDTLDEGRTFDFTFFWGHRPTPDGRIGPSCCSQWFDAGFTLDGVRYPTAEHFMMAEKARLFGDQETLARILQARTPQDAKGLGRKVRHFDSAAWEARAFDCVVQGNLAKFSQNPRLGAWLRSSVPSVLVEASPEDAIWGIGLHRDDPRAQDPRQWEGKNLLGFALMVVRDELMEHRATVAPDHLRARG